jgi:hypothetical protein
MGAREYARSFQQRALADAELLWKDAYLARCRDTNWVVQETVDLTGYLGQATRVAGVDLAIATESSDSAYFVLLAVAIDADGHRWILNMYRERVDFGGQVGAIVDFHHRYAFRKIMVEKNGYQKAILDHLGSTTSLPLDGMYTGAAQKHDVAIGIPSLANEWERGLWHVPWGDAKSRRVMEPLLEELALYPGGFHTDTVMAMFFARECVRETKTSIPKISVLA